MTSSISWQDLAADKRKRLAAKIPSDWLIPAPSEDVLDVTKVPLECGLLSPREIEITETTDVELLLKRLASSEWSSVEVTTAFAKRVIIAQQTVCRGDSCSLARMNPACE